MYAIIVAKKNVTEIHEGMFRMSFERNNQQATYAYNKAVQDAADDQYFHGEYQLALVKIWSLDALHGLNMESGDEGFNLQSLTEKIGITVLQNSEFNPAQLNADDDE